MPEVRADRRKRASPPEKEVRKRRRSRVAEHIQMLVSLITAKSRVIRGARLCRTWHKSLFSLLHFRLRRSRGNRSSSAMDGLWNKRSNAECIQPTMLPNETLFLKGYYPMPMRVEGFVLYGGLPSLVLANPDTDRGRSAYSLRAYHCKDTLFRNCSVMRWPGDGLSGL
jgi:hypothetical protein